MPVFVLDDELNFPSVDLAEPDGLLAIGGDLSTERLLLAYQNGIFPWYEGDHILWWSPDPRFVLIPVEIKVSKSMKNLLRKHAFDFTINRAFREVIRACKKIKRKGQYGTWITDDMETAYILMHQLGYAVSAEAWDDGELVGGLYGIRIGNIFYGESMFSKKANASKFAFIRFNEWLQKEKVKMIDCQVYTEHLETLGARMISRDTFINILQENLKNGKAIPSPDQ